MTIPTTLNSLPERKKFRIIPPIETFPRFVNFAQTPLGKCFVLIVFGLGFKSFVQDRRLLFLIVGCLGLTTFWPKRQRPLLALSTILVSAFEMRSLSFLAVIALGLLLFWCARKWPHSMFARRPVAILLSGYSLALLAVCAIHKESPLYSPSWAAIGLVSGYIWFIAYALSDRNASLRNDLSLEAGTFHPFWGSTNTPYPKGAAYLRRIEASDSKQLAMCQLKGLKLLAWALLLAILQAQWMSIFHTRLHIPLSSDALAMSVRRNPYPWYVCWESQLLVFFEYLLEISILGHKIIACCRMVGFNALRNTYRPLSSTTLIEFFNRFYYYFKELLVDFFLSNLSALFQAAS